MQYVLIIHDVDDYQKWKSGFDDAAILRKNAGEIKYQVLQDEQNGNRVVHFSQWASHKQAKHFFESKKVQKIRKDLGVDQPKFIYLNEADSGIL